MTGSGGRLGIVDLSKPGENKTPQLEIVNNGCPIVMQWDPFCDSTLAVGSDSAEVRFDEMGKHEWLSQSGVKTVDSRDSGQRVY